MYGTDKTELVGVSLASDQTSWLLDYVDMNLCVRVCVCVRARYDVRAFGSIKFSIFSLPARQIDSQPACRPFKDASEWKY